MKDPAEPIQDPPEPDPIHGTAPTWEPHGPPEPPVGRADAVTALLQEWQLGDHEALERVVSMTYQELKQIARRVFAGEKHPHTLQPTALISEAYLRLREKTALKFQNRLQFFSFAGFLMRRILVQHARTRNAKKRRSEGLPETPDQAVDLSWRTDLDVNTILKLDRALKEMERFDQRKFRIVVLRFFAGMAEEEIAEVMALSPRTVRRDWKTAKSWLAVHFGRT